MPRTAQPPYSHVQNSTRVELDQLGLTALRAMVDVEPSGSSDLGGDPLDDEPPSSSLASEAVPRTPWLGQGIQPVSGPLTPCTEGKAGLRSTNPMYGRCLLTPGASPAGACSVP